MKKGVIFLILISENAKQLVIHSVKKEASVETLPEGILLGLGDPFVHCSGYRLTFILRRVEFGSEFKVVVILLICNHSPF